MIVASVLGGFVVTNAPAGGPARTRPIEFSDPKSDEVTTNLNQLRVKKDSLKQLEEEAYKAIQSFSPKGSLDGEQGDQPIPQPRTVVPSKRLKEMIERRKDFMENYFLLTPEDLTKGPTLEEMFKIKEYGPDGREKKKQTVLEQTYERLRTKKTLAQAREESISGAFTAPRNGVPGRDDPDLPPGMKDTQEALKKLFDEESSDNLGDPVKATRSAFSDPFGLGDPFSSPDWELQHKKGMDEYRAILDPNWHPSGTDSSQPATSLDPARPTFGSVGGNNVFKQAARESAEAAAAPINPTAVPLPPQDVTLEALGKYGANSAPLKTEVPKQPTLKPTFDFPKRPGL